MPKSVATISKDHLALAALKHGLAEDQRHIKGSRELIRKSRRAIQRSKKLIDGPVIGGKAKRKQR